MSKQTVRINLYSIIQRAVEEGLLRGYTRAFKHTSKPGENAILSEQMECVMLELTEVVDFDGEEG